VTKNLNFDSHHANDAGYHLGSLVWHAFLFDESPFGSKLVSQNIPEEFASYIKKITKAIVKLKDN